MALETISSLSDNLLLSLFLSSNPPPSLSPSSPSNLKLAARTFSTSSLTSTKKIFGSDNDGVSVTNRHAPSYSSLANANLVFFRSGYYNVEIAPREEDSEEKLVNDFRRSVYRAGVLHETRRRRFFETSQEKKKRKSREAAKKNRKRRPNNKSKPYLDSESSKRRDVEEEEDDNWALPPEEIEIPYTNRF
ncbi:unnamed protein product [Cochlearia groenlandica]